MYIESVTPQLEPIVNKIRSGAEQLLAEYHRFRLIRYVTARTMPILVEAAQELAPEVTSMFTASGLEIFHLEGLRTDYGHADHRFGTEFRRPRKFDSEGHKVEVSDLGFVTARLGKKTTGFALAAMNEERKTKAELARL